MFYEEWLQGRHAEGLGVPASRPASSHGCVCVGVRVCVYACTEEGVGWAFFPMRGSRRGPALRAAFGLCVCVCMGVLVRVGPGIVSSNSY